MLRTTCVATMLEGGHAANALPQLAAANVNCRVQPDDSLEYVMAALKKAVADDQVAVTITDQEAKLAGFAPASGHPARDDAHYGHHVAGRGRAAHHGHGRDRRPVPARGGHPDLRRPGLLRASATTTAPTAATSACR